MSNLFYLKRSFLVLSETTNRSLILDFDKVAECRSCFAEFDEVKARTCKDSKISIKNRVSRSALDGAENE